jgi:hypothetical protein
LQQYQVCHRCFGEKTILFYFLPILLPKDVIPIGRKSTKKNIIRQNTSDRPDIVARVFNMKLNENEG